MVGTETATMIITDSIGQTPKNRDVSGINKK